jgi:hypothetical protein
MNMKSTPQGVTRRPVRSAGLTILNRELVCTGYTLYCHLNGAPRVYLIDITGETVHTWDVGMPPFYAELLEDGNLLMMGYATDGKDEFAIREFSWDGKLIWEFSDFGIHHDFSRLPNGNTMLLCREKLQDDIVEKVKGGLPCEGGMYGDFFAEITPSGGIAWDWHAYEHLDFEGDVICPRCHRSSWIDANSCEPLPNGNILTAFRHTNTVAIIERKTGDFQWKLKDERFGHPHDTTILPNGNVLFFDNGMHTVQLSRSRVLEIDIKTNNEVWTYLSKYLLDFFSPINGSAQRLWNGNTLICEGNKGRIFEVTPQRDIVWEYYNPEYLEDVTLAENFGKVVHNWVYRARRYPEDFPAIQINGL